MRRIAITLMLLATLGVTAGLAQEKKQEAPKAKTVEGTIVDMKCYSMNAKNIGDKHVTEKGDMPACATACAKMGIPVGLLAGGEAGGDLYVLVTPATALADHMAKTARITGTPALNGRGLIPDKIEVKTKDGKWEEVKIATMM